MNSEKTLKATKKGTVAQWLLPIIMAVVLAVSLSASFARAAHADEGSATNLTAASSALTAQDGESGSSDASALFDIIKNLGNTAATKVVKAACEAAGINYDPAKTAAENIEAAGTIIAAKASINAAITGKTIADKATAAGKTLTEKATAAGKTIAEKAKAAFKTDISDATITAKNRTYTGKALKASVTVTLGKNTLKKGTDFTVTYTNNKNAGTGIAIVKGTGSYTGSAVTTFKIKKASNPMTVKGKTAKVKASTVKKGNATLKASKVLTIAKAQGTKSFKKTTGSKKISIDAKTGNVKIAKGLKAGTYKIKAKVGAAGTANYKKVTKTVTFKVKVA